MVEAQSVEHLVLHGVMVNAARALQGQILAVATASNVGVASVMEQDRY